jgi:hypothetical protein
MASTPASPLFYRSFLNGRHVGGCLVQSFHAVTYLPRVEPKHSAGHAPAEPSHGGPVDTLRGNPEREQATRDNSPGSQGPSLRVAASAGASVQLLPDVAADLLGCGVGTSLRPRPVNERER